MLRRIDEAFRFSEGVIIARAPFVEVTAPRANGELREQNFMDKIAAKRNLVRFMFVALVAAFFLRVVLG